MAADSKECNQSRNCKPSNEESCSELTKWNDEFEAAGNLILVKSEYVSDHESYGEADTDMHNNGSNQFLKKEINIENTYSAEPDRVCSLKDKLKVEDVADNNDDEDEEEEAADEDVADDPEIKAVESRMIYLPDFPISNENIERDERIDDPDADSLYLPSKPNLFDKSDNQDTECPSLPLTSDQLRIANEVDALLTKACSSLLNTREENQSLHQEKDIYLDDGEAATNSIVPVSVEDLCSQEEKRVDVSHKDGHNTEEDAIQSAHYEEEIHPGDPGQGFPDFLVPGSGESHCNQEESVDVSQDQQQNSQLDVGQCKISQKRVWDKKDNCIYCDQLVTNFTRHMARNHAEELEVGKILSLPKRSKNRRILFEKLRKKGNFYYNSKCLKEDAGSLIVVQRPKKKHNASKYLPCKMCLGFFSQECLYRHMQKCKLKTVEDSSKNARSIGNTLLFVTPDGLNELKMKIFPTMISDDITKAVQEDSLICEYGARMLHHHKDPHMKNVISQKMRELGRLKLELKKIMKYNEDSSNESTCQLEDYIDQDLYKQIVSCVHSLAGFDQESGKFKIPSLSKNLGFSLKTCSEILECKGIMTSNENLVGRGKRFAKLFDKMWKFDVSLNAEKTLDKPKFLPLAEDLKRLHDYLTIKEESLTGSVQLNPSELEWRELAEITLVRIILLNRRRSEEAQRIKVSEFQAVSNLSVHSDTTELLTETEKTLCKSLTRFVIRGKGGRPVPVLLTSHMKKSVDILISTREKVHINPSNPYLFAIPETSLSCLRGSDVLRRYAGLCGAMFPENIKSTLLRKHVATMSQLLNLNTSDIESLATFMGHSVNVHKEYYRLPDDVGQIAKISKLLLALEAGQIQELKGQDFDNIPVSDDEPEHETFQISNALDTDGDDENLHSDVIHEIPSSLPAETGALHLDNVSDDPSVVNQTDEALNSNVRCHKKRRATVRKPWSIMEREALVKHFKNHIMYMKVPNKEECLKCIEKESCLSKRSWSHVKFQVKNLFGKL